MKLLPLKGVGGAGQPLVYDGPEGIYAYAKGTSYASRYVLRDNMLYYHDGGRFFCNVPNCGLEYPDYIWEGPE